MTPSTVCAGFHKCGVYPLDPDVNDCSISVGNSEKGNDEDQRSEKVLENAKEKNSEDHLEAQQSRLISEQSGKQWPAERLPYLREVLKRVMIYPIKNT